MKSTKEQDKKFEVIAKIMISNGDLDVLLDCIPYTVKKRFIDSWEDEIKEAECYERKQISKK